MDISILSGDAIRVRGKNAIIIINPTKATSKTEAHGIINLNNLPDFSDSKIDDSRITIKGPGEYEVGGIKIRTQGEKDNMVAMVNAEMVKIILGTGDGLEKLVDKVEGVDLLVVNASKKFNYSSLTNFDAKVVLVHGDLSVELLKELGKAEVEKIHKYSVTVAKLPAEPQYFLLG